MAKQKTEDKKEKKKNDAKPKRSSRKKPLVVRQVTVENLSDINGNINIAGRDIVNNQFGDGLNAAEIAQLFTNLYADIKAHQNSTPVEKETVQAEVEEIQSNITETAQKNEKVSESFLLRRFRNIARMSPDILDLVVKTVANPILGITDLVNKIALKAKEEIQPG